MLTKELDKDLKRKECWGIVHSSFQESWEIYLWLYVLTTINSQASDRDFYLLQTVRWLEVIFKALKIFLWLNGLISGNWTVLWSQGDLK